tara:strand:- start:476 stop:640 length:165 start_codon:yes stop_codon:yes gene_type:complete
MKRESLKKIYIDLKKVLAELEAEIYADASQYTMGTTYEDVLTYYEHNDDDGDPD